MHHPDPQQCARAATAAAVMAAAFVLVRRAVARAVRDAGVRGPARSASVTGAA